jgi:toxin-antitoxin system PIN domain toxin
VSAHLLDANLLIALAWPQHVHHAKAHEWFAKVGRAAWATCPLTELAFIRISSNPKIIPEAVTPREALTMLMKIVGLSGHHFWTDEVTPTKAATFDSLALVGHRQVTSAYLVALAQHHKGKLATLDGGVLELIKEHAERSRHVVVVGAR